MKIKRAIALAAALACAATALAVPAFAEGETTITEKGDKTALSTVQYTVGSTWMLNIPATMTFDGTRGADEEIGVKSVNLQPDRVLQISVADAKAGAVGLDKGILTLTSNDDAGITAKTTVSLSAGGAALAANAVVASFMGVDPTPLEGGKLYYSALRGSPAAKELRAGTYKGTVSFTAEIVPLTITPPTPAD